MSKRILFLVVLLVGVLAGAFALYATTTGSHQHAAGDVHAGEGWTCPMHPEVTSAAPGKCPKCGMDLVKEASSGTKAEAARQNSEQPQDPRGEVVLDGRRQQLIGVRTTRARRMTVQPEIRATGVVTYDETRQAEINLKVDGWIRDLHADYTGQAIRRGDLLFTLYSPDLLATQNEYLLALRAKQQTSTSQVADVQHYSARLLSAARERLLLWDVSPGDIDQLERTGKPQDAIAFRSPVSGFIVEKAAVKGMRAMPGQMLYRVADLSVVWVEAEISESDLPHVRRGAEAAVSLQSYPGETFRGRVTYIYPSVSESSRTVRVRIELPNRGGQLKPNMFATVAISAPEHSTLVVPVDALIDDGQQQLVFLSAGDGYFAPRPVKAGHRVAGDVEILSGIEEGDEVAASATFFIDSESQLRGALAAYAPSPGAQSASGEHAPGALRIGIRTIPDPPKSGENQFEVTVTDSNGAAVTDAAVAVLLYMPPMPSMNMPAMRSDAALSHVSGGIYRGTGQVLMAGRWDITVTVSRSGETIGRTSSSLIAR
jgi:Cu(I)/Ag(I) efflux system membrane fusion protein